MTTYDNSLEAVKAWISGIFTGYQVNTGFLNISEAISSRTIGNVNSVYVQHSGGDTITRYVDGSAEGYTENLSLFIITKADLNEINEFLVELMKGYIYRDSVISYKARIVNMLSFSPIRDDATDLFEITLKVV